MTKDKKKKILDNFDNNFELPGKTSVIEDQQTAQLKEMTAENNKLKSENKSLKRKSQQDSERIKNLEKHSEKVSSQFCRMSIDLGNMIKSNRVLKKSATMFQKHYDSIS